MHLAQFNHFEQYRRDNAAKKGSCPRVASYDLIDRHMIYGETTGREIAVVNHIQGHPGQ